jgi:SWI/SNF-related matrix-associated actin-dependent regulator of chromatin subfamily A member 5
MYRDWETTVAQCKDQPLDFSVKKDAVPNTKVDEEEERKWLTEMERVEASVFDGKLLSRAAKLASNRDIAQEFFNKADRRVGKETTVMVDGFAISKESMNCGEWEAVPTFAGKDPRLADPIRAKKADIEPQSHCQVCFDGGELHCCQLCPRAYHYKCLDRAFQSKAKSWQFNCPQHECGECSQKTTDAGGMLYRCRWCERAYCEDCLDFEKATLIGNNLVEYELLGYGEMTQAFYVQCPNCKDHFADNPDDKKFCDDLAEDFRQQHETRFGREREFSTLDSLTDATTIETNGVNTPAVQTPCTPTAHPATIDESEDAIVVDDEWFRNNGLKKRKARDDLGSRSSNGSFKKKKLGDSGLKQKASALSNGVVIVKGDL